MSKRFWKIRAAKDNPRVGELLLYGSISEVSWLGDEVTPRQFKQDLDALGDVDEIRVYINSPGGDVFASQAIYTMLTRHPATVTVYVDGLAASGASLVAMAGDTIRMPRNAMMMIHNPSALVWGEARDMRQMADALDKIREAMVEVYKAKTGLDEDRIIELLDAETWMVAEEAVELGFADEVEEAKQVAATIQGDKVVINGVEMDLSRYKLPDRIRDALSAASPLSNGRKKPGPEARHPTVVPTGGAPKRAPLALYERRVRINKHKGGW